VTRSSPSGDAPAGNLDSVENVLALLREQGGRVTSSRLLLLQALFGSRGHRTAEELGAEVQAAAPDVHISTIYRNLDDLERLGVIVHAHLGHGPATYHLAASAHGHFVCEECGAMIEAPDEIFRGLSRVAKSHFDFDINPHHFAMLGRCKDCQDSSQRRRQSDPGP
jgi:Fur family transcriptional regulator, ferric uptake regulator